MRRARIYDAVGSKALALVQGAPTVHSSAIFRQSNEFFYLTGVLAPQAYLLMDGSARRSILYLPPADARRAAVEGELISPEQPDPVVKLTGVDEVRGLHFLSEDLDRRLRTKTVIYLPFQPAEGSAESRDGVRRRNADAAADPWDGRPSREAHLLGLLRARFPFVEARDLSPILDGMRASKSPAELTLIEQATQLGGEAILEAMRSTRPGMKERELDALAQFIFVRHGAQGEAYRAIVASGPMAWNPHHRASDRVMKDGELVVMDYCPDLSYYRCDVTRTWPVNGRFNAWQRELYGFYQAAYDAILYSIRPNATSQSVLREAVGKMERLLSQTRFSKPEYTRAAEQFVEGHRRSAARANAILGHSVGMSTHDMGDDSGMLRPGLVFTIEPALVVPEEKIFIRFEDMVLITDSSVRILSDWLPRDMARIEKVMGESGLLETYPLISFDGEKAEGSSKKRRGQIWSTLRQHCGTDRTRVSTSCSAMRSTLRGQ